MHILQIHNRYRERGGEDSVVAAEADLLRDGGHEVSQFITQNPSGNVDALAVLATAHENRAAGQRVGQAIARLKPDVVHVHNTWYSLSPAVVTAAANAGVPVVVTLHNYRLLCVQASLFRDGDNCEQCVGSHPWAGVRHRCYRGSALASAAGAVTISLHRRRRTWRDNVDLFLVLTDFARQRFVAGGLPVDRMQIKPNFVATAAQRSAAPSASNEILFVGRLDEGKGLDTLLDVWPKMPRQLRLTVIGDGPERQRFESRGVDRVDFAGQLDHAEVISRMKSARALAFPSRYYEGMPISILEAFSVGLPVVAHRLGGPGEMLAEMPDRLVDPGQPDQWVDALARLVDDDVVDLAGTQARLQHDRHYSPEVGLRNLESAYRRVLGLPEPPLIDLTEVTDLTDVADLTDLTEPAGPDSPPESGNRPGPSRGGTLA